MNIAPMFPAWRLKEFYESRDGHRKAACNFVLFIFKQWSHLLGQMIEKHPKKDYSKKQNIAKTMTVSESECPISKREHQICLIIMTEWALSMITPEAFCCCNLPESIWMPSAPVCERQVCMVFVWHCQKPFPPVCIHSEQEQPPSRLLHPHDLAHMSAFPYSYASLMKWKLETVMNKE